MAYRIGKIALLLLGVMLNLQALEEEPWLHPPWNIHAKGSLDISFFNNVNNGYNPIDYHSTNIEVNAGLLVPFSPRGDVEIEIQLERTSKYSFGFESGAFQMRRSIFSDIEGAFLSWDVGGDIRFVPNQRLHDVAVPYHNLWNFELVSALGKEFSKEGEWWLRSYISGAIGQANQGYPWVKANFDVKGKIFGGYLFGFFVRSYFGLGHRSLIDVRQFDNGYAFYNHQNVDIGATFAILFKVCGTLTLNYAYRAYARSFPENYNFFRIAYDFPFSF